MHKILVYYICINKSINIFSIFIYSILVTFHVDLQLVTDVTLILYIFIL